MSNFNDLDERTVRERINQSQNWEAWIGAEDTRRHSYMGGMNWETRNGKAYLYRRIGKIGKSLGPRTPETEAILAAFSEGKQRIEQRLARLGDQMNTQAAILRGLRHTRLPETAARVLREMRIHGRNHGARVVGTNALYAYEALAGVIFEEGMTATGDIDILLDDRNRMRLIADTKEALGITRLIQEKVDKTFRPHGPNGYRLTNDSGYMVEFIRPLPRPFSRQMPGAAPLESDDITAVPLDGLQWLVNAPEVDTIVIDARGFPAPLICPDPRHFAAHKLWVASLTDREAGKAMRDRLQALAVIDLILQKLPQFPLDNAFIANLPAAIGALLFDELKSRGTPPKKGTPDW